MTSRASKRIRFLLERWIQRGVLFQLMLMAALVALVACLGGLVAWLGTEQFDAPGTAIWWAFLRLTDPGYLGDDEGTLLRVVSTVVTVLGYVIFMGSLIAIMTQWLAHTMRRLESGLTPITMSDHVVILGWTNRTAEIVRQLMGAQGRLRRFLATLDADRLRIVILADDVGAERRLELREHLGPLWREQQIFLRTGTSLQPEHLARLDLRRAAAVVVPGADFELGGAELTDTRIVKTLLTIQNLVADLPPDERPNVVAEVLDPATVATARGVMDENLEIIASNRILSRLVSQSVMHRGVGRALLGLLSHRVDNSLYLRARPELAGLDPRSRTDLFPRAICLGAVRGHGRGRRTLLDPSAPLTLETDDLLVFVAGRYDDCEPDRAQLDSPARVALDTGAEAAPHAERVRSRRLLVVGWSHKIATLLQELDASRSVRYEVTLLSRAPLDFRATTMHRLDLSPDRVTVEHVVGNYCNEHDLAEVDPGRFDHVLFLSSGNTDSSEESDARTVLGYVLVRARLRGLEDPPDLIVELLDPDNAHLFSGSADTVLVSPRLLSHLAAHIALRPDLNAVFDELFGAEGPEFDLRPVRELGLEGRRATFTDVQQAALRSGQLAAGVEIRDGAEAGMYVNPPRDRAWDLAPKDRILVLAPHDG